MKKKILLYGLITLLMLTATLAGNTSPRNTFHLSYRFRTFNWNNFHGTHFLPNFFFIRQRFLGEGLLSLSKKSQLGVGLTTESRHFIQPEDRTFPYQELFFHRLFITWQFKKGVLTIGRQNMIFGDGFVMMDGNPLDGSRSIYFNAVRFDWHIVDDKKVTFFGTHQPEYDDYLAIHFHQKQKLVPYQETGAGVYFAYSSPTTNLDVYAIYKNRHHVETDENNPLNHTDIPKKENHKIWTLGNRLSVSVIPGLRLTSEQAVQYLTWENTLQVGINSKGEWFIQRRKYANLGLEAVFLSGGRTENMTGWVPVFSQWPKWSESYIYTTYAANGRLDVANWSNLTMINLHTAYNFGAAGFARFTAIWLDRLLKKGLQNSIENKGFLAILKVGSRLRKFYTATFIYEYFRQNGRYGNNSYCWYRFEVKADLHL